MIESMSMSGQIEVDAKFDKFPLLVRDRLLKKAMKATTTPIKEAAKAMLKRRTGALQDAVDERITTKGAKGETVRGYIGVKRGIKVPVRLIKSGKHAGQLLVAIPTRYAHLVEFGHKIVDKHGTVIGIVAPIPFLRAGWGAAGGEVALATLASNLEEGIAQAPL